MSRSNEPTINSNRHRAIGQWLLFPILIRALKEANRFFSQLLLDPIRDDVKMIANGLLIQGVGDGEYVF